MTGAAVAAFMARQVALILLALFSGLFVLGYLTFARSAVAAYPLPGLVSLVLAALFAGASLLAARALPLSLSPLRALIVLTLPAALLFGGLLLAYVNVAHVDLSSDFAAYWHIAGEIAEGREVDWGSVYDVRSHAMLSPAVSVLGHQESAFELANVLYLTLASAASGWVAYRCVGFQAMAVATLATFLCVGAYGWAAVPTHDIPGAAVFMLGIVFVIEVVRGGRLWLGRRPTALLIGLLVAAVAYGLAMGWVQFIKSVTPFFLVGALVAWGLGRVAFSHDVLGGEASSHGAATTRKSPITPLASATRLGLLLLPLLIASAAGLSVLGSDDFEDFENMSDRATRVWMAAHTNSHGDGSYSRDIGGFLSPYRAALLQAPNDSGDNIDNPMVANLADDPVGSVGLRVRKAARAMTFTSQWNYIRTQTLDLGSPQEVDIRPAYVMLANAWAVLLALSLVLLLLGSARTQTRTAIVVSALLAMAAALVLLGQVQARYLMPIWFVGSSLIGIALSTALAANAPAAASSGKGIARWMPSDLFERLGALSIALAAILVGGAVVLVGAVLAAKSLSRSDTGKFVYLPGHVSSPTGGTMPSPYAARVQSLPSFELDAVVNVNIPDDLQGRPLRAWVRVEDDPGTSPDCRPELEVRGRGGSANAGARGVLATAALGNRATALTVNAAPQLVFTASRLCESSAPFMLEVAFLQKAPAP